MTGRARILAQFRRAFLSNTSKQHDHLPIISKYQCGLVFIRFISEQPTEERIENVHNCPSAVHNYLILHQHYECNSIRTDFDALTDI